MSRPKKVVLIIAGFVVLLWLGYIAFMVQDERQATALNFAMEAVPALERITQAGVNSGTLTGSGKSVSVSVATGAPSGATTWTITPDGVVRGTASATGLAVVWTPELKAGKVAWRCTGEPQKQFSLACRREWEFGH